ncbi:hypothetical protein TSAR_013234 [Trichomalopsis sarcophagae]|uniref:Protein TsetseEP domain-containing protein n=1 Tax=Trichomalopsis sarcophagae TaxID=543379 RepID=A0A232EX35_9HYME|nr:hypothetical protein TSAR_013234 [Trichomalopsis sarcophagae]
MKFAILFCIVAFACAAYAQTDVEASDKARSAFIENAKAKLEAAKKKIDELIEKASSVLKEKIGQAKEKAEELTEKLKNEASKVSDKVYESIKKVLDTFNGNVEKLERYARSEGIDISECTAMTQTIREAASAIIANTTDCIDNKFDKSQDLLVDISAKYEKTLFDIVDIKDNASECLQNIDGIKAAASAAGCVTVAGAKAYWALVKLVPAVTIDVTKITYHLSTLPPSVAFCVPKNFIVTLYQQSNQVFSSIKACVNEKFTEAKEQIPELPEFVSELPEVEFPEFPHQTTEAPEFPHQTTEVPEFPHQTTEVSEFPHQTTEVPEFPEVPEVTEKPKVPEFEKVLD